MGNVEKLLDEAIEIRLEKAIESTEQGISAEELVTEASDLLKARNDQMKIEEDAKSSKEQRKISLFSNVLSTGVQVALAVGGWIVYNAWFNRGIRFEETGSFTTTMTKNIANRIKPK